MGGNMFEIEKKLEDFQKNHVMISEKDFDKMSYQETLVRIADEISISQSYVNLLSAKGKQMVKKVVIE